MKKLVFSILFIFTLALSAHLQTASADSTTPTPVFRYDLKWNIKSIYYYTDTSAQDNYGIEINNAAYNWCYTGWGNSLYPDTRTTDQSNSAIDFHTYSLQDDNNGYTELRVFGQSTPVDGNRQDWDWAKVHLNDNYLIYQTDNFIQGVVAHEMGHAFGLAENDNNQYSIMCQEGSGRKVYTVQKVDNDAFKLQHP